MKAENPLFIGFTVTFALVATFFTLMFAQVAEAFVEIARVLPASWVTFGVAVAVVVLSLVTISWYLDSVDRIRGPITPVQLPEFVVEADDEEGADR